jgi:AcrR family transcriptional regulator
VDSDVGTPLSGRRAQALRNDLLILESARAVFGADPEAPIAAVAEHAGVGISALYRRYRSKDELLQRLAADGLQRYLALAETALATDGGAWAAFEEFMHRCVEAGTSAMTARFAGTFTATDEMRRDGQRAFELTAELLQRTKSAGALRAEIEVGDVSLLFELLQGVQLRDNERTLQLRHRYLSLLLDALHFRSLEPLPGPPPSWAELTARYD